MDFGRATPTHVTTHVRLEADFEALARFTSDGIAYITADGTVRAWSVLAADITEISSDDATGLCLEELFSRIEPPLGFALAPEAICLWTKDERRRAIHAMALSIDDGWLVSFGRQRTFAAIEQLKGEIVAAVSHELKTPIASIKAFATTMRQNPEGTASSALEFLATIEEQADRLAHAVDDLLLVARVDAEHLLRKRISVTVDSVLDTATERFGPSIASRIKRETAAVTVACDPELLGDALCHVLDNALKFSPDTSTVTVRATSDALATTITVSDNGIGIGEDHLPYIFERFYRVERNLTAPTGGSGLGLYVVRAIAQAHGGSVSVESLPHQGTTVTLVIPVRA